MTHVGAGRPASDWGPVTFRNAGRREPRLAALCLKPRRSPACPHPHPTPAGSGPDPRAALARERHSGGRAARGRGAACKVAVSLSCSPQPPGRGRAHSGDPGLGPDGEWRGPASQARFPCQGLR